jgi:hypothetical protein
VRAVDLAALRERPKDVADRPPAPAGDAAPDQLAEHRRRRLSVAEGGMRGRDVELERLD